MDSISNHADEAGQLLTKLLPSTNCQLAQQGLAAKQHPTKRQPLKSSRRLSSQPNRWQRSLPNEQLRREGFTKVAPVKMILENKEVLAGSVAKLADIVSEQPAGYEGMKSAKQNDEGVNAVGPNHGTFSENLCKTHLKLQKLAEENFKNKPKPLHPLDGFHPSSLALETCGVCQVIYQAVEKIAISSFDERWCGYFCPSERFSIFRISSKSNPGNAMEVRILSSSDKLPALSELASKMARMRPQARYLAGLWSDSLEVDLLLISPASPFRPKSRAPSYHPNGKLHRGHGHQLTVRLPIISMILMRLIENFPRTRYSKYILLYQTHESSWPQIILEAKSEVDRSLYTALHSRQRLWIYATVNCLIILELPLVWLLFESSSRIGTIMYPLTSQKTHCVAEEKYL